MVLVVPCPPALPLGRASRAFHNITSRFALGQAPQLSPQEFGLRHFSFTRCIHINIFPPKIHPPFTNLNFCQREEVSEMFEGGTDFKTLLMS